MHRVTLPLLLCVAAAHAQTTAPALPSLDTLRQAAAAGDWPAVLPGVTRLLALRGQAAADYDRAELVTLRAEAQAHAGQFAPAATNLDAAAREPTCRPADADRFRAWAMLLRTATPAGYRSKATPAVPHPAVYPVLNAADHPAAFAALCDARLTEAERRLAGFDAATDFELVLTLTRDLVELLPLDRVVHAGRADRTEAALAAVRESARLRIADWVRTAEAAADRLAAATAKTVVQNGRTVRVGLNAVQRTELHRLTLGTAQWVSYHRSMTKALAGRGDGPFAALADALARVARRLDTVRLSDVRGPVREK